MVHFEEQDGNPLPYSLCPLEGTGQHQSSWFLWWYIHPQKEIQNSKKVWLPQSDRILGGKGSKSKTDHYPSPTKKKHAQLLCGYPFTVTDRSHQDQPKPGWTTMTAEALFSITNVKPVTLRDLRFLFLHSAHLSPIPKSLTSKNKVEMVSLRQPMPCPYNKLRVMALAHTVGGGNFDSHMRVKF